MIRRRRKRRREGDGWTYMHRVEEEREKEPQEDGPPPAAVSTHPHHTHVKHLTHRPSSEVPPSSPLSASFDERNEREASVLLPCRRRRRSGREKCSGATGIWKRRRPRPTHSEESERGRVSEQG